MAPPYLRLKTDDATPNWLRFEIQPATNPDPANFPLGGLWALARDLRPAGPTWLRFANLGGASNMHNNAQRCTPIEPNWLRFEIQPRDQSLSTKSLLSGLRDFARDLPAARPTWLRLCKSRRSVEYAQQCPTMHTHRTELASFRNFKPHNSMSDSARDLAVSHLCGQS